MRPIILARNLLRCVLLGSSAAIPVLVWAAPLLSPADIDALPSAPADARLAYGPGSRQFGDLRLPAGPRPYPVVIVIHGCCWVASYADLQNTAALADALRRDGVATWNIEYRREDEPGGGWPGTFLDVARAADFLRSIAPRYALDLRRVVAIGHSAGGHLALWLAGRHRLPQGGTLVSADPLRLQGVVMIGGIADLRQFQQKESDICGGPVVTRLMGGTPAQFPDRYAQGSPRELLPLGVRQIFLNGDADTVVPPADSIRFVAAARAAGDRAEQRTLVRCGHFEYNAPGSAAWPAVRDAIRAELEPDREAEALAALLAERLHLAREVAWTKFHTGGAVYDPAREALVIADFAAQAARFGLDAAAATRFIAAQTEASRQVQSRLIAGWRAGAPKPGTAPLDLRREIRPRLDRLSRELLALLTVRPDLLAAQANPAPAAPLLK